MKAIKNVLSVLMLLLVSLMVVTDASALVINDQDLSVVVNEVRFNDNELTEDAVIDSFDRNQKADVVVRFTATQDISDLELEVSLRGYDQKDKIVDSSSSTMNVKANTKKTQSFALNLPYKLDKGEYALFVNFYTKHRSFTKKYILNMDAEPHAMVISDVLFSPSNTVQAGRSILTTVRVRNIGEKDDDKGLKVTVDVPGLGISASDYVEELNDDESTLSEELWLLVPKCAKAGTYDAYVTVTFRDGDEKVTASRQVTVLESNDCPLAAGKQTAEEKTVLTVGSTAQDVVKGTAGAIYPVTLTNAGKESKTYVVNVDGYSSWAKVSVSPSNVVVLNGGESKTAYVYVTPLETANAGQQMFSVTVTSGSETLKQFAMTANVMPGQQKTDNWASVKRGLEVGLIVLVVLLVILGLIIAFNKLRGNEEEKDEEEGQTYY
ncbi:putative S-layer protein [Candidatus Woesearchaeota archaeon]|nr:putative S-layer protein [Candidatus Woesearchaeota archaeon]